MIFGNMIVYKIYSIVYIRYNFIMLLRYLVKSCSVNDNCYMYKYKLYSELSNGDLYKKHFSCGINFIIICAILK